jgi:hypothetical protein
MSKFLVTFQNGDKVWNEIVDFLGVGNPQVFEVQKLCAEKGVIIFMRRLSENSPEADYLIEHYSDVINELRESFEAEENTNEQ